MALDHSLTITGSHILRLYLWEKLQAHMPDVWKPVPLPSTGNRPIIPIIPAQQQPEFQDTENPYIVYIYDTNGTSDLYILQSETLVLRVFSESPAILAATSKLVKRLFDRWDDSAADVNDWIRTNNFTQDLGDSKWTDEIKNYNFKYIRVAGIQGVQPATGEESRNDVVITIDHEFVEESNWDQDPAVRFRDNN